MGVQSANSLSNRPGDRLSEKSAKFESSHPDEHCGNTEHSVCLSNPSIPSSKESSLPEIQTACFSRNSERDSQEVLVDPSTITEFSSGDYLPTTNVPPLYIVHSGSQSDEVVQWHAL